MEDLRGKVAVITGGASGIGLAVAERVADEGMKLVLGDIEEGPLRDAEKVLGERGAEVLGVVTDVSDAASVRHLRDQALDRFGAVHLVHNNAGVGVGGPIWDVSEEDWRWILDVNLWGVVHGVRTFVPLLIEQGEGHVVNTASIAGLVASAFLGPYNATKYAVVAVSETLHKDLQMAGSPIGVSVLCPGFVQTRIDESERNRPSWAPAPESAEADGMRDAIRALISAGIPTTVVANAVVDAVKTDTFYILTHPEMDAVVRTRFDDIDQRRPPSPSPIG